MLSPADSNLATRDPAVPGLAIVLDPDRLASELASRLHVEVDRCAITYVRYKPGTSCLVRACIEANDERHDLHVTAYRPQDREKCEKALSLATAPSRLGLPAV